LHGNEPYVEKGIVETW